MRFLKTIQTGETHSQIVFQHLSTNISKDVWNKESIMSFDYCKINVFLKGNFDVVVGEQVYSPIYGDVCFLPPFEQHYGQVPVNMETDYFQIDVGMDAFTKIPDGEKLLKFLADKSWNNHVFVRPAEKETKRIVDLCYQIQEACIKENLSLAYALVIVFLNEINQIYTKDNFVKAQTVSKYVHKSMKYIEENFRTKISNGMLAEYCGVSESFLMRTFKKEIGVSLHTYLNRYRLLQSLELLKEHSVTEVSYMCGFSESSHYIMQFKKYFGYTPYEYKKREESHNK